MFATHQRNAIALTMMTFPCSLLATEENLIKTATSSLNTTEISIEKSANNTAGDLTTVEGSTVQLNTMTVIASQEKEFFMNQPMTVQIIDRQEIERIKFSTPAQIINRIAGASRSRNLRFSERDKGYTTTLIDGVSVNDPYGGSTADIINMNTLDIERIETIKGPASALYWNNSFGGVINIITRDPAKEGKGKLWFEGGTYDRLRGGGSTEGWAGDLGYRLNFNLWNIEGWRQFSEQRRQTISSKLIYYPDQVSKLTFRGEFLNLYREKPSRLTEAQFRQNPRQARSGNNGEPSILSEFNDIQSGRLFLDYQRDVWQDGAFKVSYGVKRDTGFKLAEHSGPSDLELYNMNGKISLAQGLGFMDATLTVGSDVFYSINHDTRYASDSSRSNLKGDEILKKSRIDKLMLAGFAQLQFSPVNWAHITAGGRYETIEYEVDIENTRPDDAAPRGNEKPADPELRPNPVIPLRLKIDRQQGMISFDEIAAKAGISFDLTEKNKLWFNYSEGFYVPSSKQLFTANHVNLDLAPERLTNFEVGISGILLENDLSYNIAFYHASVKDKIVEQVIGLDANGRREIEYINADQTNKGIESLIRYQPNEYIRFGLTHTYALNQYDDYVAISNGSQIDYSGNTQSNSSEHHFNGRIAIMPLRGLEFEFEVDAITDYHTHDDNTLDTKGKASRPEIMNIRARYKTGPMEFWLHALNITDEKYAREITFDPDSGGQSGSRNIQVGNRFSIYTGIGYRF